MTAIVNDGASARPDGQRRLRTDLAVLTGTKLVANTALRWAGPFMQTLERAFSASTGTLTGIMGLCELGGLSTAATGPLLDRGRERQVCAVGLGAVAASSFVALTGSVAGFAVSFSLLILGVSNLTVAAQVLGGLPLARQADVCAGLQPSTLRHLLPLLLLVSGEGLRQQLPEAVLQAFEAQLA